MKNLLRKLFLKIQPDYRYRKLSYSQYGEDLIVRSIFLEHIGIAMPTYLDLGAHHPFHLNNTALFYKLGSRGINIEANPDLYQDFEKYRTGDINLNIGVSPDKNTLLPFYVMKQPEMNTFIKSTADNLAANGFPINRVVDVQCFTLANIISKFCNDKFPDFLSIDIEGLDEAVLAGYDFSRNKPKVICVENIEKDSKNKFYKRSGLREILIKNNFVLVADTFINDIFIDRKYLNY